MKYLFFIWLLLGFYGMSVCLIKQYLYSSQTVPVFTGQGYCKQQYGNLASITSVDELLKALTVMGVNSNLAWIGLNRSVPHVNIWHWTDGEEVKITLWSTNEPDDQSPGENCAVMRVKNWFDTNCAGQFSTLCSRRFLLVKEKKTWEEALKHCRSHYTDLVFVDSQTQLDLLKIETEQAQTASVWTGLRFLDGKWFWVNGMPLGNRAPLRTCPVQPYRCGTYNFDTNIWENRDCNETLNFLCYY